MTISTQNAGIWFNNGLQTTAPIAMGVGQSWGQYVGARANNVTYYNQTSKPIAVSVSTKTYQAATLQMIVNGLVVQHFYSQANASGYPQLSVFGIVPPGGSYRVFGYFSSITSWAELR